MDIDDPLKDAELETHALWICKEMLSPGQRLGILADKGCSPLKDCFQDTPYWRNLVRRHVATAEGQVEVLLVSTTDRPDPLPFVKECPISLGVYFGGVSDEGNMVTASWGLDCDKSSESIESLTSVNAKAISDWERMHPAPPGGRRGEWILGRNAHLKSAQAGLEVFFDEEQEKCRLDKAMREAMSAFPGAQFFGKPNGKWHAHGRLEKPMPAAAVKEHILGRLPASCKHIEVFPKVSELEPKPEGTRFVGNQMRMPFGSSKYLPAAPLKPIDRESTGGVKGWSELAEPSKTYFYSSEQGLGTPSQTAWQAPTTTGVKAWTQGRMRQRAQGYLDKMDPVVEGSLGGRYAALFAAAACCIHSAGLDEETVLSMIRAWNEEKCIPPLSDDLVLNQIKCARRYGGRDPRHKPWADDDQTPTTEPCGVIEAKHWSTMTCSRTSPPTPDIWCGIVKERSKIFIGGPSKARKTWTLMGLAVAVASGREYLGHQTVRGPVLYINMEIKAAEFSRRLEAIRQALEFSELDVASTNLQVLNLRGKMSSLVQMLPSIMSAARRDKLSLIVLDPLYKIYGSRNENDAGEMTLLCNELDQLAEDTGAAVAVGLHYAKGSSAKKEAIDRTSGSGVFGRDPDTILNLSPHEEDDRLIATPIMRDHAPMPEFVVKWKMPLMTRDYLGDPSKIKQPGAAPGVSAEQVLHALASHSLKTAELVKKVQDENPGVGINKIKDKMTAMGLAGELKCEKVGYSYVYSNPDEGF